MSELQIHIAVVDALRRFALPGVIFYHAANGEVRDKRLGAKLKAMGVRAGTPDLCFTIPPNGQAAYLELKAKGGRLSPAQAAFRDAAVAAGALWACADSPEAAFDILAEWGVMKRLRIAA